MKSLGQDYNCPTLLIHYFNYSDWQHTGLILEPDDVENKLLVWACSGHHNNGFEALTVSSFAQPYCS